MKFGTFLYQTQPSSIASVARKAEELGYESLWIPEHIILPINYKSPYPYSKNGRMPAPPESPLHDPMLALAYAAAITSKIRLATGIYVLPIRNPITTAKAVASLDVLSGGRFIFGIGIGWLEEEFEGVGMNFKDRAARTREYVALMKEMWTKDDPVFHGKTTNIEGFRMNPKPVQKPHPPIWVGGESGPALRRTARIGDAWYPIGTNPQNPLDSLTRFKTQVARLRKMTVEAGRDPNAVGLSLRVTVFGETAPAQAGDGEHRLLAGPPAVVAADIRALRDMGVGCMDFGFGGDQRRSGPAAGGATADDVLAQMQRFRAEVLSLI